MVLRVFSNNFAILLSESAMWLFMLQEGNLIEFYKISHIKQTKEINFDIKI